MILKKYNYMVTFITGLILLIYFYGTFTNNTFFLLYIIGLFIVLVIIQNLGQIKLRQYLELLEKGNIEEFERVKDHFITQPKRFYSKVMFTYIFARYDYIRGDHEKALQDWSMMFQKCEHKRLALVKHYQKNIATELVLFYLVQGDIDKAGYYETQLQELMKKPMKLVVLGNMNYSRNLAEFAKEALRYEQYHDKKILEHLIMLLEDDWPFYAKLYLLSYIAQCYESIDITKAMTIYQDIVAYGGTLEIALYAKERCRRGNAIC